MRNHLLFLHDLRVPATNNEAPAAAAAKVAPPVYAKRFSTFTGRPALRILLPNQSQFTACSGKSPVCLKLKGFKLKVSPL